jgi:hypothetical protein
MHVAIYRLLKGKAFGPEEVRIMTEAYELVLKALNVPPGTDAKHEMIAKFVFEIASTDITDADRIRDRVLALLSAPDQAESPPNGAVVKNGQTDVAG